MSQRAWNWLIALGIAVLFVGLLFVPAALSGHDTDSSLLGAGGAIFSLGALMSAIGMYFKAQAIKAEIAADPALAAMLNGKRRKGCDACHTGAPVVQCTMHRMALCAACLAQHYDSRACVYVPAIRRTAAKTRGVSAGRA